MNIDKIVRIGTMEVCEGRSASIYCKIKYRTKEGKNKPTLSISGVVGPTRGGNALGSCGQIDMSFWHEDPEHNDQRTDNLIKPEAIDFAEGWNRIKWLHFLKIWKLYHLNDMSADCKHQRQLGWNSEGYDMHPSEPCPTCGYKFGTAWNWYPVPKVEVDFLYNLPNTDRKPAWC